MLTLPRACEAIRKGQSTDVAIVEDTIEKELKEEDEQAFVGRINFASSLSDKLGTDFEATAHSTRGCGQAFAGGSSASSIYRHEGLMSC